MKSAVETLGPTRAKLTVEVPFEELKPSLDKAYQTIAQQINVPGFRRGKVPPMVIDRQVGRGAVLEQAINEVVPQKYVEALQSHDLQPLAQPEIEVTRMDDNESIEFTAEVDVRPEITVPDWHGLTAEVDDLEVTDDDVTEQIEALRERFGTLTDVDRPAADGDFVVIDLVATKDGEPVEGAEVSGMSYRVGRGGMLEGLDEALAGMSAGDDKVFSSQLVGGDLVGEDVQVQVKVSQVQEQELPELDDEFAQLASEFDTADELTDDVRTRLGNGKRLEQAAAARDAVLEKLLDLVEVPLPETVVADELNRAPRATSSSSSRTPASPWRSTSRTRARPRRSSRPTSSAASATPSPPSSCSTRSPTTLELGVDQNELTQHMVRRAQQSGQDPQEFANHMFEHNHIPELVAEIRRGKALAQIVESATVTDGSGNVVDLKNLRPDGTLGDPAEDRRRRGGRGRRRRDRRRQDEAPPRSPDRRS